MAVKSTAQKYMAELTPEVLNPERLRAAAGRSVYDRGQAYYSNGQVKIEQVADHIARCTVRGGQVYHVEIKLTNSHVGFNCDCPYAARGVICKHDVAAALAIREHLRKNQPMRWKPQLNRVLDVIQTAPRRSHPHRYLLFFSLQEKLYTPFPNWRIVPYHLPLSAVPKEYRSGEGILPNHAIEDIIEANPSLALQVRAPAQPLDPTTCINCPIESVMVANILLERAHYPSSYLPVDEYLTLIARTRSPLFLGSASTALSQPLEILPEPARIGLIASHGSQGLSLQARLIVPGHSLDINKENIQLISSDPIWLMTGSYLARITNESGWQLLLAFLENPELVIPDNEETEFLEKFYLPLATQIPIEGDAVTWETVEAPLVSRIYLNDAADGLSAQLKFGYGEYEVSYDTRLPEESVLRKPNSWTLVRVQRQPQQEEEAYRSLSSNAFNLKRLPSSAAPGTFGLRARAHPVDFLLHSVPRLAQEGFEVFGEDLLKTARVNRNRPTISFNVSSGIDWFDIRTIVNFGDLEVAFKDIRRALRKKERYIKLADGTIGEIPAEWIERYRHLFALGEEKGESLRLSQHHLTLIDELLSGADRARTDKEFERRRQQLRQFSGIAEKALPRGFQGELRPYQKAGYDWLHFLHEFEFGGCLADDMGLGKTIQALAFIQSLREGKSETRPQHACLVVAPRSLLINWQREAARFTPDLRLLIYFEKDRIKDISTFDQYDVVLTTYGVMLRDIPILHKYTFDLIVLDESQTIKNPLAQTGKAARLLIGKQRLVLTGTPVENSTVELWSQFAFLNPGLLGSLDYFKEEFGSPIERKGDEQTAQFLRKMVYPFILRRTKAQVAPELPPRTERILYCDMEPGQRKLYNRTRDYFRSMILGLIDKEGINNARMKVLEGLLRLRQISNHPQLVDKDFHGESGKFELLMGTLETLQSEGHKALVFSQFVQMLRLVRNALDARQSPYCYLDGQTRDRQEQVDRFQNDPAVPLFLLSLKAGGLGLNLTAADYAILIDPWWNPAVEMQASDRTHRIGQDKPVFIYKFITRDSVEEKIVQLQERKKDLVEQLISTESSFLKSLTRQDVEVLFSK